jgi:uncharacterized protein (DUF433 family)
MSALLDRITIEEGKCGGRPCIRSLRIRVVDVLEMLAGGDDAAAVLRYHPDLEADDIRACLAYAAQAVDHAVVLSAA